MTEDSCYTRLEPHDERMIAHGSREYVIEILVIIQLENCYHPVSCPEHYRLSYVKGTKHHDVKVYLGSGGIPPRIL